MPAGVTPVDQGIPYRELDSTIGSRLRVGPYFSIAISRPNIDVRELPPQILKLKALLHRLGVEQLKILNVDDGGLSVHQ